MDKNSVIKFAPHVLKRMEYGIDIFYLLNLDTDTIWTGNFSSYLITQKINGINSIDDIINELLPQFESCSYEDLYNSTILILEDLLQEKYIVLI